MSKYDDDYSDDFVSDEEYDSRQRSRGARQGSTKGLPDQATKIRRASNRRESDDFWLTAASSPLKPTRRSYVVHEDSPIQSDRGSDSNSLEDDIVYKHPVLSFPRKDTFSVGSARTMRLQSAHTARLSLSRGLTRTRTPASKIMAELAEEPMPTDERERNTEAVPQSVTPSSKPPPQLHQNKVQPNKTSYGKSRAHTKPKGRGRGRGQSQKQSPRIDNVTQRLLSASRIKMNELRNQYEDQKIIIRDLHDENKLLKKMQYRQGKALEKFEDQESDLPRTILRHNNEVRTLREQLRAAKDKYERTDRYLRDAEDDLEKATAKMKKYKNLAEDKSLPERDELNKKLSKAEIEIEDKDNKIKELQRHIDHLARNHRHELGVEIARHRETKRQLDQMREDINGVENKLKEKEKELEIKNIYSNRALRPANKMPASYGGTPLDSPPAGRRRIPSITEMTAREKAKVFEMKRREEMKKNKPKPKPRVEKTDAFESRHDNLEDERNKLVLEEKQRREEENRFLKALEEQERERDREEERRREQERKQKREREMEEEAMRRERDRMKRESEELQRKEEQRRREHREREEREEHQRMDREKQAREEQNRLERERREREERDERAREMERLAQEERDRLENDPKVLEERRKKDLLLARLKAIDDGSKENISPPNKSPFEDDISISSSKKSYSFSKPTENLHNGKPAYDEVNVPYIDRKKQQKAKNDDFGGYNPSFLGKSSSSNVKGGFNDTSSPSRKPNKKSALMDELFGDQKTNPSRDDDTFFVNSDTKKANSKRASAFPWDDDASHKHSATRHRENSSTLFGGGAALVEDDHPTDKSKLLPRRTRQHSTTFSTKPAINAVDAFEDDIEEVIL